MAVFLFNLQMPSYKRKETCKHGEWSEQQLVAAIEAVNTGMGMNEAARRFSVPCTTLRRKKKAENTKKTSLGPSASLTEFNERKIVMNI
ncbi:CENP-B N-terminal DNA-binding domain [Popillia japonica]|uniref:CENP-B N-terminal DNA-binding domain n=1 Tax=Popillia japonica TaxID=7064 RepID=A0AAW1MD13_POPJA